MGIAATLPPDCEPLARFIRRPRIIDELDQELAERSLIQFTRQAWHVVEPAVEYVPGFHLDAIAEHLEAVTRGQIRNLLINVPPRHSKSLSVAVFWPAWEWIAHPARRWIFSSYADSLSIRDSVKCRRLIESPWYRARWGNVFTLTSDQNQKHRFENNKTGLRLASSVGGAITGEGGDRVVADDPHNVKEAMSETIRNGVLNWWDQVMSTRLNDPKSSARVIVQQRVHEADLAGHVLEKGGYVHLNLPAEYEGSKAFTILGWQDPRTAPGQLLWPARFGKADLDQLKKDLGSYGAAGQLQQRPAPEGGGILKAHWWRYWQPTGADLPPVPVRYPDGEIVRVDAIEIPVTLAASGQTNGHANGQTNGHAARPELDYQFFDEVIQSWDLAFKDLKTSDFIAGGVWARKGANRFLLDQFHDRCDFPHTLDAIRAMVTKWPDCGAKLIEDKANGPAVIQTLRDEILGIIEIDPQGGKFSRAAAVSPQIEAGNVFLPHPHLAPWLDSFIHECSSFPTGAHDDQVDEMSQALTRLGHFSNKGAYDLYREAAQNKEANGHNGHTPQTANVKPIPARPWAR